MKRSEIIFSRRDQLSLNCIMFLIIRAIKGAVILIGTLLSFSLILILLSTKTSVEPFDRTGQKLSGLALLFLFFLFINIVCRLQLRQVEFTCNHLILLAENQDELAWNDIQVIQVAVVGFNNFIDIKIEGPSKWLIHRFVVENSRSNLEKVAAVMRLLKSRSTREKTRRGITKLNIDFIEERYPKWF